MDTDSPFSCMNVFEKIKFAYRDRNNGNTPSFESTEVGGNTDTHTIHRDFCATSIAHVLVTRCILFAYLAIQNCFVLVRFLNATVYALFGVNEFIAIVSKEKFSQNASSLQADDCFSELHMLKHIRNR